MKSLELEATHTISSSFEAESGMQLVDRASGRLTLARFTRWSQAIPEAMASLADPGACPRDLYLSLVERNLAKGGAVAVVERGGVPCAVVGLRRSGFRRFENLANWLMPGFVCAAADADLAAALTRLRAEITVAWWRMPFVPLHPAISELSKVDVHRLQVAGREAHWRSNGHWKEVTHARRKCSGLTLSVNQPGDAEWVIRSWAQKWLDPGDPGTEHAIAGRCEVARFLEPTGRHVTIALREGDRLVAGSTQLVHGDTLVAGVLYRDESLGSTPTGIRVIDAAFDYAEAHGFELVDLGGGHAYKTRWAPAAGTRSELLVAPLLEHRAWRAVRGVIGAARSGAARIRGRR